MSTSRTSDRMLAATAKQRRALELRIEGRPFEEIAAAVGYKSRDGAWRAVQAALLRTLQEPADTLRALERERLDALQAAAWDAAMSGAPRAIEVVLRVMERRARLDGLDAPARLDVDFGLVTQVVDAARQANMQPAALFNALLATIAAKQAAGPDGRE